MKRPYTIILTALVTALVLAGCADSTQTSGSDTNTAAEVSEAEADTSDKQIEVAPTDDARISSEEELSAGENEPDNTTDTTVSEEEQHEASDDAASDTAKSKKIVWLGDSLTQGSLGDDNDNLANAPYEKLKTMTSVPVEGYGLYGYKTNTIFWVYVDGDHYNQEVDPDNTYIFWVGSNDWVVDGVPNADTAPVISQIDDFLTKFGTIDKYIVIGTTSRYELGDMYKSINKDLAAHYGDHYLDVIDIINKYGYGSDNIHLTQATYDAVAKAVYEKLKQLGYI